MPDDLADTNIWLRLAEPSHPMFTAADYALQKIEASLDDVYLTPQVISEYWRVATSEGSLRGGFGWGVTRADLGVQTLEALYTMLDDDPAIYGRWRQVVLAAGVTGGSIFDARLVAVMIVHGLTHLLTFNDAHFRRYVPWGIIAVNPNSL